MSQNNNTQTQKDLSKVMIAPSILSADFSRLGEEISACEKFGADVIHFDVMDGSFVPNITVGAPVLRGIKKCSKLPFSVHLMIDNPSKYLEDFIKAGANLLSFHVEAEKHLDRQINYIKSHGVKAGIALNPGTPVSSIIEILPIVDFVLIMTVNPGFGGQSFIPYVLRKIDELAFLRDELKLDFMIEVDGGVNSHNAFDIASAGADILVAGNAIFAHKNGIKEGLSEIRKSLNGGK